jgi:hypothetical protein
VLLHRSRPALLSLALAAAAIAAAAPGTAAALTKAERRAVDIVRVEAATTANATLIEVVFRGMTDRLGRGGLRGGTVEVELAPAKGQKTTIEVRGTKMGAKGRRSGTKGTIVVAREGRAIHLLVEGLAAATSRVAVTTSGPGPPGARASKEGDYDKLVEKARRVAEEGHLDEEIEEVTESILEEEGHLESYEGQSDKTIDRLHNAQKELNTAKSAAKATEAREEIDRQKEKLARLVALRQNSRLLLKLRRRWRDLLERFKKGGNVVQCNDGGDNGDPEDTIADHPADPGCMSQLDNDEKDNRIDAACPPDNGTVAHTIDVYTPASNAILAGRIATVAGVTIAVGSGPGPQGPTPVTTTVCGPETTALFSYGVGPFAPNGEFGPLSPPPGDTGARFVIEFMNPPGGDPGGGSVDIVAALDTRAP